VLVRVPGPRSRHRLSGLSVGAPVGRPVSSASSAAQAADLNALMASVHAVGMTAEAIRHELDSQQSILADNIDRAMERGDRLESLQSASADLSVSSRMFQSQAQKKQSGGGVLGMVGRAIAAPFVAIASALGPSTASAPASRHRESGTGCVWWWW
jgi:hypothetical protein